MVPFAPFPKAADRIAWLALPADYRDLLVSRGEQFLHHQWGVMPVTGWLTYTRTGNRVDHETLYFARRRALNALVMAECVSHEGRFLDDIVNGIFLICEESAWQLPAHNSYVRNTPTLPLPDTNRPLLDLFACETGALLATIHYLLAAELQAVSPLVTERIERELKNRILRPYLDDWFWWMGGHGEQTNNWTVWCTQNALIALFLLPVVTDIEHESVFTKATDSINAFLADYGQDGCCDEGAQYFRHAGLCLFNALEVLDAVSGGMLASVWQDPQIHNIARYILNVHVDGKYYINFADCSPFAGYPGVREYLFGKRVGDSDLCAFAVNGFREIVDKDLPEEINLYYRAQAAFAYGELMHETVTEHVPHGEIYYPSTGLFIARDDRFCLAVKAGDNGDGHNHNDVGSVTLYKNGQPLLIDVGVESYSSKTFSSARYEIWTMQSSFHNLAEFDGVMQCDGEAFHAESVTYRMEEAESGISMQLQHAWPPAARLNLYERSVTLCKGSKVVLRDRCEGSFDNAVLNLMFCVNPVCSIGSIELQGLGMLTVDGMDSFAVEEIRIQDARLRQAWPEMLYRVRLGFHGRIKVEIE